ncbi:glucose-6-phosphate isomerase [bacterium BMS3Bbin03]|nr:glucose-6-phosphate isomerase [bacterium BMS3Bbin03]
MDKQKLEIRLDYSNVMSENIGETHGLARQDLEALQDRTRDIHFDFYRLRERKELPFMNLPYEKEVVDEIKHYVEANRGRFENYVHIGIGGSALGPIAVQAALHHPFYNLLPPEKRRHAPRMFFLDNIDPDRIAGLLDVIDPAKTLFSVVTKSGGTAETISTFMIFMSRLQAALKNKYRDHLVFITDPVKGFLRKLAADEHIQSFSITPGVGGRFSVLTPVGLFPAMLSGLSGDELLSGAGFAVSKCGTEDLLQNPAYLFGAINYLLYRKGKRSVVMLPYSDRLYRTADWFRQLWAESLGKRVNLKKEVVHVGPTPIKALGVTDQHSQVQLYVEGPFDKLFAFLEVESFSETVPIPPFEKPDPTTDYLAGKSMNRLISAEKKATELAMTRHERPNVTFKFPVVSEFTLGQIFMILEIATAYTGRLFEIDPFNQPGVEEGKLATYAFMGREGFQEKRKLIEDELNSRKIYQV